MPSRGSRLRMAIDPSGIGRMLETRSRIIHLPRRRCGLTVPTHVRVHIALGITAYRWRTKLEHSPRNSRSIAARGDASRVHCICDADSCRRSRLAHRYIRAAGENPGEDPPPRRAAPVQFACKAHAATGFHPRRTASAIEY